eukprot:gene23630-9835_t
MTLPVPDQRKRIPYHDIKKVVMRLNIYLFGHVLWAANSTEVDPAQVARPHTSNPKYDRVMRSPVAPVTNTNGPSCTPERRASEILWAEKGDVAVVRPRTANPILDEQGHVASCPDTPSS